MNNKTNMSIEILKAQVSNKSADTCADISIRQLIFLSIICVFILAFPFINQRVKQSTALSDARFYPGLGGVFQKISDSDYSFSVTGDKLTYSFNSPKRQIVNDWIVIFTNEDPYKTLESEETSSYQQVIIFTDKALLVNQPQYNIKWTSGYKSLGFFSSSEIKKVMNSKKDMITFVKAFLFACCISEVPMAILTMIVVVLLQYLLLVLIIASLLCFSKFKAFDKTRLAKVSKFIPSLKIVTTICLLPSIIVALISYFNSSLGITTGWLIFSLIVGVRAIVIYMQRIKSKSVVDL